MATGRVEYFCSRCPTKFPEYIRAVPRTINSSQFGNLVFIRIVIPKKARKPYTINVANGKITPLKLSTVPAIAKTRANIAKDIPLDSNFNFDQTLKTAIVIKIKSGTAGSELTINSNELIS